MRAAFASEWPYVSGRHGRRTAARSLHLPSLEGSVTQLRQKSGPPLAGHGAEAVNDEIARVIANLPE